MKPTIISHALELSEKASPIPWKWENGELYSYKTYEDEDGEEQLPETLIIQTDHGVYPPEENDGQFIAESRELLPTLAIRLQRACEYLNILRLDAVDRGKLDEVRFYLSFIEGLEAPMVKDV